MNYALLQHAVNNLGLDALSFFGSNYQENTSLTQEEFKKLLTDYLVLHPVIENFRHPVFNFQPWLKLDAVISVLSKNIKEVESTLLSLTDDERKKIFSDKNLP